MMDDSTPVPRLLPPAPAVLVSSRQHKRSVKTTKREEPECIEIYFYKNIV